MNSTVLTLDQMELIYGEGFRSWMEGFGGCISNGLSSHVGVIIGSAGIVGSTAMALGSPVVGPALTIAGGALFGVLALGCAGGHY